MLGWGCAGRLPKLWTSPTRTRGCPVAAAAAVAVTATAATAPTPAATSRAAATAAPPPPAAPHLPGPAGVPPLELESAPAAVAAAANVTDAFALSGTSGAPPSPRPTGQTGCRRPLRLPLLPARLRFACDRGRRRRGTHSGEVGARARGHRAPTSSTAATHGRRTVPRWWHVRGARGRPRPEGPTAGLERAGDGGGAVGVGLPPPLSRCGFVERSREGAGRRSRAPPTQRPKSLPDGSAECISREFWRSSYKMWTPFRA